jgi:hypothetical protein
MSTPTETGRKILRIAQQKARKRRPAKAALQTVARCSTCEGRGWIRDLAGAVIDCPRCAE